MQNIEDLDINLAYSAYDLNGKFGGSVWESNPPCPFVTGNTGFEVQERHQNPIHSRMLKYSTAQRNK
jgi:hypothetical protein